MLVVLGWMLVTGLPLPSQSSPQTTPQVAAPRTVGAAGRVSVWTDRDEPYRRGESARVYIRADEPAHIAVFRVDTDGRIRVLFPRDPWGDTFVRDQRNFEVTGSRGGRSFRVDDFPGLGYLLVVASPERLAFGDITRGEYWDYRLIGGGRLRGDPYVLLPELAGRITRSGDYAYYIAPYYVDRRYDYPRFVCYDCHAYASYEEWDPYERACSRFRIVVYDGPARYPYGRGRNVVAPAPAAAPRFVFRDADPGPGEVGRSSVDVGGQGSVPAPGAQALGRRSPDQPELESDPARPRIEERRRQSGERRRRSDEEDAPEGLRPAGEERRPTPGTRPARPPRSTGEPELRRRRP